MGPSGGKPLPPALSDSPGRIPISVFNGSTAVAVIVPVLLLGGMRGHRGDLIHLQTHRMVRLHHKRRFRVRLFRQTSVEL